MTFLYYSTVALAALSSLASAVPSVDSFATLMARETTLKEGERLVNTGSGTEVMNQAQYEAYLKSLNVTATSPPPTPPGMTTYNGTQLAGIIKRAIEELEEEERNPLKARQDCDSTYSIVVNNTQTFVDWDVQMSPVVCATGDMLVAIANGYSVSNSITVSAGLDAGGIAKKLAGSSVRGDFTKTWTSSSTITTTGNVKSGNCGVMITQPIVTRTTGTAYTGCPGSLKERGTWQADSHRESSYNGISWVEGAISMCLKPGTSPPLSRCHGDGNFI